ncbi:hypothetical protein ACN24M_39765 [Streptomyces microflavus]
MTAGPRLVKRDEALAELTAFKTLAVSRLTAQHERRYSAPPGFARL